MHSPRRCDTMWSACDCVPEWEWRIIYLIAIQKEKKMENIYSPQEGEWKMYAQQRAGATGVLVCLHYGIQVPSKLAEPPQHLQWRVSQLLSGSRPRAHQSMSIMSNRWACIIWQASPPDMFAVRHGQLFYYLAWLSNGLEVFQTHPKTTVWLKFILLLCFNAVRFNHFYTSKYLAPHSYLVHNDSCYHCAEEIWGTHKMSQLWLEWWNIFCFSSVSLECSPVKDTNVNLPETPSEVLRSHALSCLVS